MRGNVLAHDGNFNKGRGNIAWLSFSANEQSLGNWLLMFFIDRVKLLIIAKVLRYVLNTYL